MNFIWKFTISSYGIVNHLGFTFSFPDIEYWITLIKHFIYDAFVVLSFPPFPTFIIRFIPCIAFAIVADIIIFKY